ncbi:MAG TPA: family 16 glycoside hydrolase [Thermomicrobiaceae bacterium]|nr:family 16 glycoside hydrolase [Thermomicrobiaceae bacterium]
MSTPLTAETTTFSLDNMGRYLCNSLQEALDSAQAQIAGRRRDFDVIIVGGGTFGSVMAHRLFAQDRTHSRRILVLEAGPFVLPEHNQNMSFIGGDPAMRAPWVSAPEFGFPGLVFAVGGRSISWGGWSPEPLHTASDDEMHGWPASVIADLRGSYFYDAADQIGVSATNDFVYGVLQEGLRCQLLDGLAAAPAGSPLALLQLSNLPDHPVVRAWRFFHGLDPNVDNGTDPSDAQLRDWLALDPATPTPPRAAMLNLLKLEAPLAVQARTVEGLFPFNKFSAVPIVTYAARTASSEADGTGPAADARKRLQIIPECHVQDLITETQSDNWVRVVGVRAIDRTGTSHDIMLAPPSQSGTQSVVVIALGTIESTRLALSTFQQSLAGRAAQRMGKNLMAHLRSNLTIRLPRAALTSLPPSAPNALQVSALLAKGKATIAGTDRYFHLQITASGLAKLGTNSESELFRKVPSSEQVSAMLQATDDTVVLTLRGIGQMGSQNPDSRVELAQTPSDSDFGRPKAWVTIGNAKAPTGGGSQTQEDRDFWDAMDAYTDEMAVLFANGQPFEILVMNNNQLDRVIPVPAGTPAAQLKTLLPYAARRDGLGTTHHEAGTLWMSTNPADGVTNEFGRIHDTTNCYVAGPALFPTVGSPNPMLIGVGLARRTADMLTSQVLPSPAGVTPQAAPYPAAPGYVSLFDGTAATFKNWVRVSPSAANGFALINGQIVTYGGQDFGLLYHATQPFADFTLKVQFRIFNAQNHNSGVFVRFRDPLRDPGQVTLTRMAQEALAEKQRRPDLRSDLELYQGNPANRAWSAVYTGFEVQIDDTARGDPRKDFYGVPEDQFDQSGGLRKNRTGAIYKIPAGDFIPQLNQQDAALQTYQAAPALIPGAWYEYTIDVRGDTYTVDLTDVGTGQTTRTTTFQNTDPERGLAQLGGQPAGYVGIQSYSNAQVAFGQIQISP